MTEKIKSVAVYCGHQFGADPAFERDAKTMGELLGRNKFQVVFGGGNVGLMGAVASAALHNGSHVLGVTTCNVVAKQEPAHEEIDVEIVPGVNERKQKMFDLSDAFIIMPGGIGTLNELTDIMTMQQIGESCKPLFFLNTGKFWDIFGKLFVFMHQEGFIESVDDYNMHVASTPQELIQMILKY